MKRVGKCQNINVLFFMEKTTIIIPSGYRYLGVETKGDVYGFDFCPGIYNKPTGIGFTHLAIVS